MRSATFLAATLALGAAVFLPGVTAEADGDLDAAFSVPITVSAGEVTQVDAIVEEHVDFGALFDQAGSPGPLDPASLVVTEVDAGGNPLSGPLTVQFNADSPGASAGTLLFQLPGETPAGASRRALIEFDHSASAAFAPQVGPAGQVTVTDTVDGGQDAFKISTPRADWYLQKQGASFSSVVDAAGKDWVGYHPTGQFDGTYRGIGQLTDDYFHPGGLLSSVTRDSGSSGPLKAVFNATSTNGWTQRFEVYPTFVRATVTPPAAAPNTPWWYLYEGSPNGDTYIKDGGTGTVTRSDGTSSAFNVHWDANLAQNPSWVNYAVGDRSFFMSHHSTDGSESHQIMGTSMVVFGFGRTLAGGGGPLIGGPQTFTYGILETGNGATAGTQIAAINSQTDAAIDPGGVVTTSTSSSSTSSSTSSTSTSTSQPGPTTTLKPATTTGAGFVPVTPKRLLDTRATGGPLTAGTTRTLTVRGGETTVAANADAVVLNVTATDASRDTFVRVWPSGIAAPATSSLNLQAGDTVPNLVTTAVGGNGAIELVVSDGSANLIVDVVGYYSSAVTTGGYHAVNPVRALDTREGPGTPLGASGSIDVDVAGALGVAPSLMAGVALNVTVTAPSRTGYVSVFPAGGTVPFVSNLNFAAGQTVANAVVVGAGGGKITAFNAVGTSHVVVDVVGSYGTGTAGAHFHAVSPVRAFDTRERSGRTPVAGGTYVTGPVVGTGLGVDGAATAVVGNITVTEATSNAFITAWPTGESQPWASMQNTVRGTTRANQAMVKVGTGGQINVSNSNGSVHVITDVVGYFS
ncbi:MAG: hypothetical protein IT196_26005 [Acidimicrobiales bacterium]|nr:hypothetical protein [Acidimicrobiales bacterium]